MKALLKFRVWGASHPKWVDYIRIALGIILMCKGITFILNLGVLDLFLKESGIDDTIGLSVCINLLAQLIIILNLLGGICIILNVQTRLFCFFNLPVLFGAVFLVNIQRGTFNPHAEFWLSLFAFMAIISLLIMGENTSTITQKNEQA